MTNPFHHTREDGSEYRASLPELKAMVQDGSLSDHELDALDSALEGYLVKRSRHTPGHPFVSFRVASRTIIGWDIVTPKVQWLGRKDVEESVLCDIEFLLWKTDCITEAAVTAAITLRLEGDGDGDQD